ncbi:phage tail fiber protein [Pusillimonas sp.]|uniref:phage tail fiber domain-containing protein n=1 Tax=Pusillimonas sp. TaxID=3040095 RepID=UPI0037C62CEE
MAELDQWINSAGEGGQRNSMQYLLSSGTQLSYEFNFAGGYIDPSHVKAYIYHSASGLTTDINPVVLSGPNTIQLSSPVPEGDYLVVYRDTPKAIPLVDFVTGAVMNEENLDKIAQQAVFNAAEMVDRFSETKASSDDAIQRSYNALLTAENAVEIANTATATAGSAVSTANSAVSIAQEAVSTAEDAVDIAEGAVSTAGSAVEIANTATSTANGAVEIANDALDVASGIDSKAQSALDNSEDALEVANGVDAKATQAMSDAAEALSLVQDGQSASNVLVEPEGIITATNVQDALGQLATEVEGKQPAGDYAPDVHDHDDLYYKKDEFTTTDAPNTPVVRDSAGDIRARLFRPTYTSTNSSITYIYTQTGNLGEDYLRPSTPAQVKAALAIAWGDIASKPSTFAPSSHTHAWSQITGAPAYCTRWPAWSEVTGKPSTFPASDVPAKTAALAFGAVGSYATLCPKNVNTTYVAGNTVAGSNLLTQGSTPTSTVSGSWRCMGTCTRSFDGVTFSSCTWLRYA